MSGFLSARVSDHIDEAMKANQTTSAWILPVVLVMLVMNGCGPERNIVPSPTPSSTPRLAPSPQRTSIAPPSNWRDAELTFGNWSYRAAKAKSVATYGPPGEDPLVALRCDQAAGRIVLFRAGSASGDLPLSVITTNASRAFTASAQGGLNPSRAIILMPRDSILDAIAFSRGRFAIEVRGLPTLTVPAWPEVARVIEDCR